MDNFRQDCYSTITKAVRRIERRADKLTRRANSAGLSSWQHNNVSCEWEKEISRLQDMSDKLSDFRDRLYFYSNLDFEEALKTWDNEIEPICTLTHELSQRRHHSHQRHEKRAGNFASQPAQVSQLVYQSDFN